jgi:hypothetical protein
VAQNVAILWREATLGIAAGLPGAIWVIILLGMIGGNEVYAQWTAQNALMRPHPLHLPSAWRADSAGARARRVWHENDPTPSVRRLTLMSPLLTR